MSAPTFFRERKYFHAQNIISKMFIRRPAEQYLALIVRLLLICFALIENVCFQMIIAI